MTDTFTGNAGYPGIQAMEACEFTDLIGIAPASATIEMYPQFGVPSANGDLVFSYRGTDGTSFAITIRNMHFDLASFVRNSGGQVIRCRLLDERWKWRFGSISGRYNIKFVRCYDAAFTSGAASQFVDPDHEKTPQQLALLCTKAMGYADSDWDVSRLPNDARPEINWDASNPAKALADLADTLGCVIVPVRSTGKWKLSVKGEDDNGGQGALPDNFPYLDPLDGVDPAEKPDYVEILTAQQLFEMRIALEAVAQDMDQDYSTLGQMSYAPYRFAVTDDSSTAFASSDPEFWDISTTRQLQPDQSLISPREMAMRTIFRTYKVKGSSVEIIASGPNLNINIPGLPDPVSIRQLVLTDNRVQPFLIPNSTSVQPLKAYVEGTWWSDLNPADDGNYPAGSRIDLAARAATSDGDADDSVSFSIQSAEDCRFTLITFSRQIVKTKTVTDPATGLQFESYMIPADLFLHTAVKVRDPKTFQLMRKSVKRWIGSGPAPAAGQTGNYTTLSVIKNDIQAWVRGVYTSAGDLTQTIDNDDAVNTRANFYIDQIVRTMETVNNSTRTYTGIFPIDMNGALISVSWKIGKGGADTIASLNTEHDFENPSYENRRARDARKGESNEKAVKDEIRTELSLQGLAVQ